MPLTSKQEAFCQGVALRKLSLSDAYRENYDVSKMKPETVHGAAKTLAANPLVAARLDVLRQRATADAVAKAGYTLADAIAEAEQARQDGAALGQVSAAVAAIKLKAQLGGHLVEKKEIRTGQLEDTDLAKLAAMKAQAEADLKAAEDAASVVGEVPTPAAPVRRAIG